MKFSILEDKKTMSLVSCTQEEYKKLKLFLTKEKSSFRRNNRYYQDTSECFLSAQGVVKVGLWKDILEFCKTYNFKLVIDGISDIFDTKFSDEDFLDWISKKFSGDFKPAEHQISAASKILKNRIGLAELATSAGKSLIVYIVFSYLLEKDPKFKFLMIVPTVGLITQLIQEFSDYDSFATIKTLPRMQGLNGSEKYHDYNSVVIGTYQTLTKKDSRFLGKFHAICCDEAHSAKSASIQSIMRKSSGLYRFGLTGTLPDPLSYEYFCIAQNFGPVLIRVSSKDLIEKGWISDLKISVVCMKYYKNALLESIFEDRDSLEGRELLNLERTLLIHSTVRLKFICSEIRKAEKNSLVLFHRIEYGKKIFDELKLDETKEIFFIDGSVGKAERESIRKSMETGSNRILVASFGTFSTGLNVKNLHYVFLTESFKSPIIILQSIGRGLRKHADKDYLTVVDFSDDFRFPEYSSKLYLQSIARKKLYKKQNFTFKSMTKFLEDETFIPDRKDLSTFDIDSDNDYY